MNIKFYYMPQQFEFEVKESVASNTIHVVALMARGAQELIIKFN